MTVKVTTTVTVNDNKIDNVDRAKALIGEAIWLLREQFNDSESSLRDMAKVADYARLLDQTDFSKTIMNF